MSTKLDSDLSARIRGQREAKGWTLAELAERSGVSRAMISKVERGEASPTAAVLVRLASAFGLTLAGLLEGPEPAGERLVRAGEQPRWQDPGSGYVRRQIFQRGDHPLELVAVEMPAGQRVALPAASYHRIRQLLWVQEGALVIEEDGVRHELREGDCLELGPPAATTYANRTARACTSLVLLVRN